MDYLQTLEELQNYYSNLLIIQYNGKPKAKATIELLTRLVYSNMALLQIRDAFNWKTAKGAQLDIIGQWVGVSRAYTENNTWSNTYLSYPSYGTFDDAFDDPQRGGYSDYETFDSLQGGVLTYKDLQSNKQQLSDEEYRTVIRLKIIKNSIIHNQGNIDNAIFEYFNSDIDEKLKKSFNDISGTGTEGSTCFTYGNNEFVVLADVFAGCVICKSSDKLNWTTTTTSDISNVKALIYDNDLYICGSGGSIYTSTDAENWTQTSASVSQSISNIFAKDNYYYALSEQERKLNIISKDFNDVKIVNLPDYYWLGITYFDKKFVIFSRNGYFSISTDAENWTTPQRVNSNQTFVSFVNIGSRLVIFSEFGNKLITINGIDWYLIESSGNVASDTQLINGKIYGINFYGVLRELDLFNVYTTWQPHLITYHYDSSLSTIMNICLYKNVLPAPAGVSIQIISY